MVAGVFEGGDPPLKLRVGCPYPPAKMFLVGLKKEKRLEVWVAPANGGYALLKAYPH